MGKKPHMIEIEGYHVCVECMCVYRNDSFLAFIEGIHICLNVNKHGHATKKGRFTVLFVSFVRSSSTL